MNDKPWTICWTHAAKKEVLVYRDGEQHVYTRLSKQDRADILGLIALPHQVTSWYQTSVRIEL